MVKNAYIHIPFCKSKCKYCSFISFARTDLKEQYLASLEKEIKQNYHGEKLDTLYFGGGTPSTLTAKEFENITKLFNIDDNTEITAELNPENISQDYLKNLKLAQINRLSFGCQTFDDNILKLIGRRHNSYDVKKSLEFAHNAGFENISIDFIYGLPTQTVEMFENDLKQVKNVTHVSLYGLKIDEGCYFYHNMPQNLPDDDIQAQMYLKAIEILTRQSFEHYEISNFAKHGFHSRHNLNYWDNNTYYGFGCAAHGYENGVRYYNLENLEDYIKNPLQHAGTTKLTLGEQLEEEIFLGFRKREGINIEHINQKFNIDFKSKYREVLEKYQKYLTETNAGFTLTNDGILISNVILSEFLA